MNDKLRGVKPTRMLTTAAAFVVLIAGLRAASGIIVPFLLALFISILCLPALVWLRRRRVPHVTAVALVLAAILIVGLLVVTVVATSLSEFIQALPQYQQQLRTQTAGAIDWLQAHGLKISDAELHQYLDPGKLMGMAGGLLSSLSGLLTNGFLILLSVVFILLEVTAMPGKIRAALHNPENSLAGLKRFAASAKKYVVIKTWISLATAVLIGLWLWLLGIDYPLLWAMLAFLLNYVPTIGAFIAAAPAILLALVQRGPSEAAVAALGYIVVNVIFGSVLEPRFMGRGLGLSPLIVFLSLVFWGWVLGPVGMILSVPLTILIKIAFESSANTRWLGILLDEHEPAPRDAAASPRAGGAN